MLIQRQTMEVATAALLGVFAAAVVHGSLQLANGWGDTGPQAGYFPLRLGVALLVVSALLLLQAVRRGAAGPFASGEQLQRSLSLLGPTVLMALAMPWLGTYLSAAIYLAAMARWHGRFGWGKAVALGVVAAGSFFGIFELWFGVSLLKGPIEHWLGF